MTHQPAINDKPKDDKPPIEGVGSLPPIPTISGEAMQALLDKYPPTLTEEDLDAQIAYERDYRAKLQSREIKKGARKKP